MEELNKYPDFNNYLIFVLTKLTTEGKYFPSNVSSRLKWSNLIFVFCFRRTYEISQRTYFKEQREDVLPRSSTRCIAFHQIRMSVCHWRSVTTYSCHRWYSDHDYFIARRAHVLAGTVTNALQYVRFRWLQRYRSEFSIKFLVSWPMKNV